MPVFVGAIAAHFGWGDREVGWLASADMAGSALASLCTIPIIGRMRWRRAACLAIAVLVLGNVLSLSAMTFAPLLAARALAGFGGGIMLSIAYVGLCRSSAPDRYFGLYVFSQLGLQVLALATFPSLVSAYGPSGMFLLLAAVAAMLLLVVPLIPARIPDAAASAAAPGTASSKVSAAAIVGIIAQGLYFLAPGAAWGYFERIGQGFTLSLPQIGSALSVATFAGIAGALVVVVLGTRASRWLSMVAGTALSVIAMILLIDGSGFARFLIAGALFNFAWNYTFPYQMGVLALLDRTGAVAILSLIVQLAGLAAGPLMASMLHPEKGYTLILLSCVGCYVVSLLMFRASSRIDG